jgi:hypothetical protein
VIQINVNAANVVLVTAKAVVSNKTANEINNRKLAEIPKNK